MLTYFIFFKQLLKLMLHVVICICVTFYVLTFIQEYHQLKHVITSTLNILGYAWTRMLESSACRQLQHVRKPMHQQIKEL